MALILLVSGFLFKGKAQFAPASNHPRAPFVEKMYEPREKIIKGDTVHIRPRWFFPSHGKVQFAGSIGFFSVGAGYRLWDVYEPTLMYGHLSPDFGGSSVKVQAISLKNSFFMTQEPWFNHFWPKTGLIVSWGNTQNTFKKLPPHYPEKYYFQNKIQIAPFWGGEWYISLRDKHLTGLGVYFEFSALGPYLLEAIRTDYVTMKDVWSLGLGVSFYFQ